MYTASGDKTAQSTGDENSGVAVSSKISAIPDGYTTATVSVSCNNTTSKVKRYYIYKNNTFLYDSTVYSEQSFSVSPNDYLEVYMWETAPGIGQQTKIDLNITLQK